MKHEKSKHYISGICLIDKILVIYMAMSLVYIAANLLFPNTGENSSAQDTIIRTSASAIFGYFISNNMKNDKTVIATKESNLPPDDLQKLDEADYDEESRCNKLQVIVISAIGIISVLLLMFSRTLNNETAEISATVSQLRDFLSASIGFLVSCGKSKK